MKALALAMIILLVACTMPERSQSAQALIEDLRAQNQSSEAGAAVETNVSVPVSSIEAQTDTRNENEETQTTTVATVSITMNKTDESDIEEIAVDHETSKEVDTNELRSPEKRNLMYSFLDTFAKEVSGYSFIYKGNEYLSRGTSFKVILDNPVMLTSIVLPNGTTKSIYHYDVVYVDRSAHTAIAYCEGVMEESRRQCDRFELDDVAYPVSFEKYNIMLPEDWLFAYLDVVPTYVEENKYYVEGKNAIRIVFNATPAVELNFDPLTGLVLRTDILNESKLISRHDYEELARNTVREVDVRHRSKSEIPSSESFYG